MSGSTIGGIVGGVIGWFVGGPAGAQWGFMIGSAVGAIVAPEQFEGPRLAEAKTQTANDGVPLIYGYGTFPCSGNLAWVDEVKEHKKTESQKGGPEVTTYTYTVSYMIVVCQGEISGYKLIKRNGKIVYDARTDAELSALGYSSNEIAETRANQAAFLQRATLYYGTQTQMPDPTMVAVEGAGNVPAYTGIAYIVLKDDETREGEVSQYEFVVANCGDRHESDAIPTQIIVSGTASSVGAPVCAMTDGQLFPAFTGISQSTGADLGGCIPAFSSGTWVLMGVGGLRYSTDPLSEWNTGITPFGPSAGTVAVAGGPAGWIVSNNNAQSDVAKSGVSPAVFESYSYDIKRGDQYFPIQANSSMRFCRFTGGFYYGVPGTYPGFLIRSPDLSQEWQGMFRRGDDGPPNGNTISGFYDVAAASDGLYATVNFRPLNNHRNQLRRSTDGGLTFPDVLVDRARNDPDRPWQIATGNGRILALSWGCRSVWTSVDGFANAHSTGIGMNAASGAISWDRGQMIAYAEPYFYIISGPSSTPGEGNMCVRTLDGITFSDPVPLPISNTRGIAVGGMGGGLTPIPDAPGHYIDPVTGHITGPAGTQIDPCQPSLGEIVADQCERRGVTSRDVSELTELVGGYRVAAPSTPQRNIQGLQPGYFFSASEFDGTLHFPKRGRPLTFALTHDDFVERDGDPIQWERTQEPELLRKVTVGYVDPETTYTATTQMAERRAATISAEGESTTELAVTGSKDWAAQAADKAMKVAWGEPDECTFHVSIEHAELVTGAEGVVPYTDGTSTAIRIDRIEDEGLVRMVTGRRTRANLYQSNAAGIAKQLPRFPGSNIRGPVDGLLINMPILLDGNDAPGIYWAAAGMLSGYIGATLQIFRAGQWVTAGQATGNATMGTLLSPLPSHDRDVDFSNVVHLRINGDLESVTFHNLISERNPLAILRPDGTAEIVQFQTANEVAAGEYELTTLIRGRLDTGASSHSAGARVVFLDDGVNYASLDPTDLGQPITYRFVSIGTDPDAATVQSYPLATMESQREWQPYRATYQADGDDWIVRFIGRHRLGTDQFPVASTHFNGWRIDFTIGVTTHSHLVQSQEWIYTEAQQIADWGSAQSDFDSVSVTAINQYTNGDGAGGAGSGTIAIKL